MPSSYMFQFCSQRPSSPLPVLEKHVYQPLVKGTRALGTRINMFQFPCMQDSEGKSVLSLINRKNIEARQLCLLKTALNIFEKGVLMQNLIRLSK